MKKIIPLIIMGIMVVIATAWIVSAYEPQESFETPALIELEIDIGNRRIEDFTRVDFVGIGASHDCEFNKSLEHYLFRTDTGKLVVAVSMGGEDAVFNLRNALDPEFEQTVYLSGFWQGVFEGLTADGLYYLSVADLVYNEDPGLVTVTTVTGYAPPVVTNRTSEMSVYEQFEEVRLWAEGLDYLRRSVACE
ncbi:MAG: hypothetical protein FWC75_08695 [Oscillospiraceae bacterium]|nr:hypothetical protein [Oscillospiraceae bacterium]